MAVFRQELNWSTYQEKQMKVLESIEKSLSSNLVTSRALQNNMSKIEQALTSLEQISIVSAKNISAMTREWVGTSEELNMELLKAKETTSGLTKTVNEADKGLKNFNSEVNNTKVSLMSFVDTFSSQLATIGQRANEFSEASNRMIKLSGMSGDAVRDFRSEVVSTVNQLNLETGSAYSPYRAYDLLISTSQGVTSNLEAIEEMARPLLLSYESMDVSIDRVATLFNRFYTRYTFSSKHMEDTLDNIRGNTAGNSASAEDTVQAIETLQTMIGNVSGGDNDKMQAIMENISTGVGWQESLGLDHNPITDMAKQAYEGKWNDNLALQVIAGALHMDPTELAAMTRDDGDYLKFSETIIRGIVEVMSEYDKNKDGSVTTEEAALLGVSLDKILPGLEQSYIESIYQLFTNGNYQSPEEFIRAQEANKSMEELVGDKFYTLQEKSTNWLENIYKKIADIQEYLPFGFSDVVVALLALKGLGIGGRGVSTTVRGVGSFLGGAGGAGTLGAGKLATAVSGLSAAGAAGVLAGGGLAVDGLLGIFDSDSDMTSKFLSTAEASAGVIGAAGLLGVGAATGPLAPLVLAIGGAALLGKKAYENATALSGNAEVIESYIEDIGESLEEENTQRLSTLSNLSYQFDRETDLEKQRELLKQSGIFTEEDLQNKSEDQLKSLIDSYKDAASAMNEVTDGVMKLAEKYYTEQENEQQKGFIEDLKSANLSEEEMTNVIRLLQTSVGDEDLLKKFDKALKDDSISKSEFNDLLSGGKNSWFDQVNLTDKGLEVAGMRQVAGYLGWDKEYTTSQNAAEVVKLYNALAGAPTDAAKKKAWQDIVDSGLESEVRSIYGKQLGIMGYADGTNYIARDQLALVHEGEAITPKKYNPAANMNELEALREQSRRSQEEMIADAKKSQEYMRQTFETLNEIKEFLSYWRDDNIKRENSKESKNRFSASSRFLSNYTLETT